MTRVVVITGSSGAIGSALRERFSAHGDLVVGLDAAGGEDAIRCDVADEEAVASAFATIRAEHGPPTVLVNNAGMTGAGGVEDEDPATWRRILDVNLTGAYLCAREVVAGMGAAGGGKIVNIASVAAIGGAPDLVAYSASKAGVVNLTRAMAKGYGPSGIRVNCVLPGTIPTDMHRARSEEHTSELQSH